MRYICAGIVLIHFRECLFFWAWNPKVRVKYKPQAQDGYKRFWRFFNENVLIPKKDKFFGQNSPHVRFHFFYFSFILREFCQNLKTLIVSKQLKKKSWNLFNARLYQGIGAKPEADREVHSRGLMAQRVTREVSILFIKFHECQPWFHFLWPYLGKNTENKFYEGVFWAEIPWKKNDRKSCTFCVFTGKIFDFFSHALF